MNSIRTSRKSVPGLILVGVSLATFITGLIGAQDFRDVSRWFPLGVSIAGIALAVTVLLWELGIITLGSSESFEQDGSEGDGESSMSPLRGFLTYMAWLAGLMASLMIFGALISVFVWLTLFFRFRSKESVFRSVLYSLAAVVAVVVLVSLLHLFVPVGWVVPSGSWIPQVNLRF